MSVFWEKAMDALCGVESDYGVPLNVSFENYITIGNASVNWIICKGACGAHQHGVSEIKSGTTTRVYL